MLTPAVCARHHVAGCAEPAAIGIEPQRFWHRHVGSIQRALYLELSRQVVFEEQPLVADRRMTQNQLACDTVWAGIEGGVEKHCAT